jgi:hypothetical protein
MAVEDFNTEGAANPLLGIFPEDTLSACCSVLAYLQAVQPRDVLNEQELFGLQNIHLIIERALGQEIGRISTYRMASYAVEASHG